jgi:hypothetical protein
MHPLTFSDEVIEHRGPLPGRFRAAPTEAFHQPLIEYTWSCEAFFRHLLVGLKWMMDIKRYTGWDDNPMYQAEVP